MRLVGKTPKQPFLQGCTVAFVSKSSDGLALHQRRKIFSLALTKQQSKVGLSTPEQRAQWAAPVFGEFLGSLEQDQSRPVPVEGHGAQGHAWKAYWIPFQNQIEDNDAGQEDHAQQQHAKKVDVSKVKVGEDCDLVVLYFHGGGFIDGFPLQTLDMMLRVMKQAQAEHNLKIGFLSVDYSK